MAIVKKIQEFAEEPLAKEEQEFLRQQGQLLQLYNGEFVALYQGRVVGHGIDDEELAGQMFETLGNVPFYIGKVEDVTSVYELPSPEVVR